jgi:TrmH family RNA methyltransferase
VTGRHAGDDLAITLSNVGADRVKQVRALAGRSARLRAHRFVVEGPQCVREAVRFAAGSVLDVYVTSAAHARSPEIAAEAAAAGLRVYGCSPEVAEAMSGDAQGVIAVVGLERAEGAEFPSTPRLVAILADARDPGNAGTVIRAADAAGADAVMLAGESVEATNPKVLRSSAGSFFHLPVVEGHSLAEAVAVARAAGLRILATDGAGRVALGDGAASAASLAAPTAWMFGNEARGLSPEDLALADATVRIPMYGRAESLNLGAAATLCLFASAAAHRASADNEP